MDRDYTVKTLQELKKLLPVIEKKHSKEDIELEFCCWADGGIVFPNGFCEDCFRYTGKEDVYIYFEGEIEEKDASGIVEVLEDFGACWTKWHWYYDDSCNCDWCEKCEIPKDECGCVDNEN